ncbi:hypothetical protein MXAN_6929 [Myxococcus xanthus DK 1622]|uniref:Uncharacterized protein n=1 Tax=Myxococcus xanthus (strain DK1622) TaxID=246197 RepID=Q1CX29_MYXXD|nr:hypothetical protein MXAN_6929 [Myxococcus xanthus DK 1622]
MTDFFAAAFRAGAFAVAAFVAAPFWAGAFVALFAVAGFFSVRFWLGAFVALFVVAEDVFATPVWAGAFAVAVLGAASGSEMASAAPVGSSAEAASIAAFFAGRAFVGRAFVGAGSAAAFFTPCTLLDALFGNSTPAPPMASGICWACARAFLEPAPSS